MRKNINKKIITLFCVMAMAFTFSSCDILSYVGLGSANNKDASVEGYEQKPLQYSKERKLVLANLDKYGRAVDAHIQLKNSHEPKAKRERLTVDPKGWHNYRFKYKKDNGRISKAWLFSRGHLVGYQFSGLNNNLKNLVQETAYMNAGAISGMDQDNEDAMLYYENNLDDWLYEHPTWKLDYQVTPLYKGTELVPRQIRLAYLGYKPDGTKVEIKLGTSREEEGNEGATVVYLDNVSPNAKISYENGMATAEIQ